MDAPDGYHVVELRGRDAEEIRILADKADVDPRNDPTTPHRGGRATSYGYLPILPYGLSKYYDVVCDGQVTSKSCISMWANTDFPGDRGVAVRL